MKSVSQKTASSGTYMNEVKQDTSKHNVSRLFAELLLYGQYPKLISVSQELDTFSKNILPLFQKIEELKRLEFIEGYRHPTHRFNDEPFLAQFSIRATEKIIPPTQRHTNVIGGGKSYFSPVSALEKALGEIVERISLFAYHPKDTVTGTIEDAGDNAIDLSTLVGLTPERRAAIERSPEFIKNHPNGKVVIRPESQFTWTKTSTLSNNNTVLMPLQLVSLDHSPLSNQEPIIRMPLSTGAAAGSTFEHALTAAILEIIERDAYMITWLSGLSPERIDLASASRPLQIIHAMFHRYALEFHAIMLPTDFELPVCLGVLIDRSGIGPAVTVGIKAGFDLEETIEGVAADVVASRAVMRQKKTARGLPNLEHLNLANRSYYWFAPERIQNIAFLLTGAMQPKTHFDKKYRVTSPLKEHLSRLLYLKLRLYELAAPAFWTTITAPELAFLNIPVVKVLIPSLQPVYVDECIPYHDGDRLGKIPALFGLTPSPAPPQHPHPFA